MIREAQPMFRSYAIIMMLLSFSAHACDDWFKKLKIKDAKTCESKCRTALTDMSTFMCTQDCEQLCKSLAESAKEENNFYGLTDDEISFCKKNRIDCLKAYRLSIQAEESCLSIYKRSDTNDESDACRHYMWAFFMAKEIGEKNASLILTSHENNPKEDDSEKEMDLANNKIALDDFRNKEHSKKSDLDILNLYKKNLKNKKFKVI
ncbi:MAG: hypothetical protein H7328_06495 [Bdellovibrio sp.]|nr:hypothetical protein [Bdellovibrio sp.]